MILAIYKHLLINVEKVLMWKILLQMIVLYMVLKVGDPEKDHECWMRPENMKTSRSVLQIDQNNPGTEIAAETSAAMAASSMVFRNFDQPYARRLLNKAELVIYHSIQYFHPELFHLLGFCPVSIQANGSF